MRRRPGTLFTPAFIWLTLSDLAYFIGGGALIGVTPFFVTGPLGGGAAAVGLAVGAFSATTLVLRPLAGRWADRHGRRPLLIGGALLFALLVVGHLLVTDLAWLVVLRLLLGGAEALYFVAGFAALADLAPPGRAGEALSYNSLALYLGIATGPIIGQALLGWGGFPLVWAGVGVLLAVAALLAARVPETLQPASGPSPPAPLIHPAALVPGLGLFIGVAVVGGFMAFAWWPAASCSRRCPTASGRCAWLPPRSEPPALGWFSSPRCRLCGASSPAPPCWGSVRPSSPQQCSRPSSAVSRRPSGAARLGRPVCSSTWGSAAAPSSWA
jgi:MFS family permease